MLRRQSQAINMFKPVVSSFKMEVAAQLLITIERRETGILTQRKVSGLGWFTGSVYM